MADRQVIEKVVRAAYEARTSSDLDGVMRHFADSAVFSVAGSPATSPIPTVASGRAAIREVLRRLLDGFDFKGVYLVTMLVDGPQAAFHWHVRVKAIATGHEVETDILDLVRFEGDKIVSFRQFADTALVNRMVGA